MGKNTYTLIDRFECYGNIMVTVLVDGKNASIMTEREYNRIIETERKYRNGNKYKVGAQ